MSRHLSWLCLFFLSHSAWAVPTLFGTFRGDQAATLPQGRILLSYTRLIMPIEDRFSSSGEVAPVSSEFNTSITWNQVATANPERSLQVGGLLDSHGLAREGSAGQVVADFAGQLDLTVLLAGYGLSDRLGIYVAAPVQRLRMQSQVGYRKSSAAQAFVDTLRNTEQEAAAYEVARALNEGFQDSVTRAGYRNNSQVDRSELGDIRVEVPYVFPERRHRMTLAWIQSAILPTGSTPDPADLFPVASGQGRFHVGTRGVATWKFREEDAIDDSAGALLPLPARIGMRVPRDPGDRLSPDIDSDARVSGGLTWMGQIQGRMQISRSWRVNSGLQHQQRARDRYQGYRVDPSRYVYLSDRTDERLESAFASVEMNTIRAFLDRDFPIPLQMTAGVSAPIDGRNSMAETYTFLQSTLFF